MNLKILETDFTERNDIVIIRLSGKINSFSEADLAGSFKSVRDKGKKRIILSMEKLDSINSRGIKLIVNLGKWMEEIGGDLKIADMQSKVRQLADIFGLDKMIEIYENSEQAIKSFDNNA